MTEPENLELTRRYRAASEQEGALPDAAVRAAVLAEAARIAAARATRPAANDPSYWRAAAAALAVVAFAGILLSTMFRDPAVLRVAPAGLEGGAPPAAPPAASPAAPGAGTPSSDKKAEQAPIDHERAALAKPATVPSAASAPAAQGDAAVVPRQQVADVPVREPALADSGAGAATGSLAAAAPQPATAAKALARAESNAAGSAAAAPVDALHLAAISGDEARVEALLDAGAEVDATDGDGRTALIVAAANGRSGVVRLLLARGASVRVRDRAGRTALSESRARHDTEIAALLERAGARE